MQIRKKDGTIKNVHEQIGEEKRYGWQGNQYIPGVGEAGKVTKNPVASGSRAAPNATTAIVRKAVETIQKAKAELENNLQTGHKEEPDSLKNASGAASSFFSLLVGMVSLLFFCSIPLLLVLSISASLPQTDASGIVEAAEHEESLWEHNVGGKKYKQWYGINGNWCAMFVSYCANECGYIDDGIMPKSASVANMAAWYKQRGQFVYKTDDSGIYYEPKAGDIIFFQNGMSHVGIVVGYDPETRKVTAIEGNTGSSSTEPYHAGSRVKRKTYPITYRKITGYGQPDYPITVL